MAEDGDGPRSPGSAFDHVTIRVKDLAARRAFYLAALAPLGFEALYESPEFVGMGSVPGQRASFWLVADASSPTGPLHLCFQAAARGDVEGFYAGALSSGGRCNGPPGYRPEYHPGYYAAFVLDPDGNNIELVFRDPEVTASAPEPGGV